MHNLGNFDGYFVLLGLTQIKNYSTKTIIDQDNNFVQISNKEVLGTTFNRRSLLANRTAAPTAPNNCSRRVSPVVPRPREGPLTEPTAGAQPWPRERVLMSQTRLCRGEGAMARLVVLGPSRFAPACDAHA